MTTSRIFIIGAAATAAILLAAVNAPTTEAGQILARAASGNTAPATYRRYGSSVELGDARARSYVTMDAVTGTPLEIGVALDEDALNGLPTTGSGHHEGAGHAMPHTYILDLPTRYSAPFTFVELNWNPSGHEPEGVYMGKPHFDFHFYTTTKAEREAIVPSDPQFAARANNVPAPEFIPPFNAALAPPGAQPAAIAVPMMGVHWVDVRSPELQAILGKPDAYRPFTTTFIHGSWDGRVTFWEPMITRAHILEKRTATDPAVRDQIIPLPVPAKYQVPGYYPTAYRITWDGEAREYRIALTQLVRRD